MKTFSLTTISLLFICLAGCGVQEPSPGPMTTQQTPSFDPNLPVVDADGTTLRLQQVLAQDGRLVVDLEYHPSEGAVSPRMMEVWLGLGSGIRFLKGEPLESVSSSGKLFVARDQPDGLRVVVLSTSDLAPMPTGALGRLYFEATGQGSTTVSVLERMPIFAPPGANQGLSLPPMLTLQTGGAP
jgi:hypothetical protein